MTKEKLQGTGARLPPATVKRLERVARAIPTPPGAHPYTRADALRAAVEEGLDVLEARYAVPAKTRST